MSRIVFSLLGLGLLGLFVWLIVWWIFLPTVRFAFLPVVDYDVLAAPPIPYVAEDVAGFASASPHGEAVGLRDLQTSEAMPTLAKRLQGALSGGRDTLVLYVAAHGVSVGGQPCLLTSDFRRDGQSGRYSLADLLEQLRGCRAGLKLLVLDAGGAECDPPSGVLVNQFPRLLEKELTRIEDPSLWVLLSNRPLETARVSRSARRSAFGHYVSEGLRGGADLNGDRKVDVAELSDFVRGEVSAWARRETAGQATQTPWLLRAGSGDAPAPPGLALVPVRPRSASEDAEDESAGEPKASEAGKAPVPGAEGLRRLLDDAWAARDAAARRSPSAPWSPVDYAPHVWREFEAMLLGYEARWAGGGAYDAAELARDLRAELALLPVIVQGQAAPAGFDRSTVLGRLVQSRDAFLQGALAAGYEEPSPARDVVREAVLLQNDLAFRAVDYVRWHARAAMISSQQVPAYASLRELLATGLPGLDATLASLGEDDPSRPRTSAEMQSRLDDLRQSIETLARLRDRIEVAGLQREARELVRDATVNPRVKGIADRMDGLLAVAILPARLRGELLAARGRLEQPFEAGPAGSGHSEAAPGIAAWQRERIAEQAELEVALVALADPDGAAALPPRPEAGGWAGDAAGDAWWDGLDRLGAGLGAFYQGLPERIGESARGADAAGARRAASWLRLVDGRDARRVGPEAVAVAVPPMPKPPAPEPSLAVTGPESLTLDPRGWSALELKILANGLTPGPCSVTVEYDAAQVEVETPGDQRPVAPRQAVSAAIDPGRPTALAYRARPRTSDAKETTLSVSVAAAGRTASHSVLLKVPPPDLVELLVRGPGATVDRRPGAGDHLRLQPFPNRVTEYRFALANRSDKPRTVQVDLWGIPATGAGAPGKDPMPVDESGMARPGFARLQPALEVQLPGGGTPVAIPFPPPPPAEKGAAGGAGDGAKEKPSVEKPEKPEEPQPSPPDQRPVVTSGMVCTVTDVADRARRFTTWIEFAPLAPKVYLDPVVSYDPVQQRIAIEVKARDADGDGRPDLDLLPPSAAETPIRVAWDTAGVLDPGTEMKDVAELAPPQYTGMLFAKVEQGADRVVPVRLSVDGYPRAFQYLVRCDRARPSVERERSMCKVRIAAPREDDAFLAPAETVPVQLQVDAPEDAFQQPGDVVEAGIDEDGDNTLRRENKWQASADRQVKVRLDGLAPEGAVRVASEVGDFKLALPASGLKNKKVRVLARLAVTTRTGSQEKATAEDSVGIALDGAQPAVEIQSPSRPVVIPEDLPFSAAVEDLSGAAKMDVGLDLNGNGALDEEDKPKTLLGPAAGGAWSASFPTKELSPGQYELIVRTTDRVGLVKTEKKLVRVAAPGAGMTQKPPANTATIQGRVVLVDKPISGIEVTIEGLNRTATTDEQGRFIFRNVPHGGYKLTAKGAALNKFREGAASVTLPGASDPAIVDISLK